jgi:hypothetical protein
MFAVANTLDQRRFVHLLLWLIQQTSRSRHRPSW